MKAKFFLFLFLLLLWPIAFAVEQAAPSAGISGGQTTVIRIVDNDNSKEGQTNGENEEEITKEDFKKKETRRKIADRNKNEDLVIEGEDEESTDETLETIVDGEGIDPETPGMPETALSEPGRQGVPEPKRTPAKSEGDGSQTSQEGKQGGAGQSGGQQQDSGMNMNTIAQMLPIITQLLGLFKEQPSQQQQQSAQTTPPLPPEKPKPVYCKDIGGKLCSQLKNECSDTVSTPDAYGNSICCVSECKPLTKTDAGIEAKQNVEAAKAQPSAGFQIIGDGNTIASSNGQTQQKVTELNKGTDTVLTRTDTIDVLNGKATNLYTLTDTIEGVKNHYGIFLLDSTGETLISVAEENGALTQDDKSLLIWLAPGITKYSRGIYETNTRIFSAQTGVVLQPMKKTNEKVTGKATFSEPKTAFTFGSGGLSALMQNAIDVSFASQNTDYIILAKGNEDMLLLGKGGFFPLAIRKFAKGDTSIIYDLAVKVNQRYKVKDSNYEYTILTENDSTKVKIPSGKIIEESGSMTIKTLSNAQQQLITKDK